MSAPFIIGFDIGGSRLKSGVVRLDGTVERPTLDDTADRTFSEILEGARRRGAEHIAACGDTFVGIGVALPGIVEAGFGSRYLPGKVIGIEGFPLCETLEDEFGKPVRCVNDGTAATLAEWQFGAGRGLDDLVGLTIGTGLGSGVIVNGAPLDSANLGTGTSVGHFTIDTDGVLCLCGNRGCAETLVSADAVAGKLRDALTRRVPSILADRFAKDPASVDFTTLVESARAGDRVCVEILEHFKRNLGAVIVSAIHAYNPSAVVLGGGGMAAADLFLANVQAYVDRYAFVFPKDRTVELRPAQHEAHSGVLGAAASVLAALDLSNL